MALRLDAASGGRRRCVLAQKCAELCYDFNIKPCSTAIFYALITAFSFGIANAISKELSQKFGAIRATVLRNIFVALLIVASLVILQTPFIFDWHWIGLGLLIAFGGYLGFLCFMLSLKNGKVGVVVPVASGSIIVSSFFGFLILGDTFGLLKAATVSIVFIGVALASLNFKDLRNSDMFSMQSGVPYALLCALIWSIAFPLYKFPSDHLGALFYALIIEVVVLVSAYLQIYVTPRFESNHSFREFTSGPSLRLLIVVAVATVGTALGTIFLNFAYQTGEVSIVSAIYGSSSIVALITGAIVYREVLSKQQYLGAVLVVLGILLPIFTLL